MNRFHKNKLYAVVVLALGTLYGCGGGAGEVEPDDVPVVLDFTYADIKGSAVKGTLSNAAVSVSQLNGAPVTMQAADRTDASGNISFSVQSKEGFGLNSMFKIEVTADDQTRMVCDAVSCAGVALGSDLSGPALTGSKFSTLAYVAVPYANASDAVADATFRANALTTIATDLVAAEVAAGRNVSVRALYEMALADNSQTVLKALGVSSKANLFQTDLISAERYENFVTGEDCKEVATVDDQGNPVLDAGGQPVLEEQCTDTLVSADVLKLSLLNAAFAHIAEGESITALMAEVVAAATLAQEGDVAVLTPLRERVLASISQLPYLAELSLTAEDVVDLSLAFLDPETSSAPVHEITTADNIATAIITGRNRISNDEAESKAFDGDIKTKWLDHNDWKGAPSAAEPSWIQVQFAQPQAVNSLLITSADDSPARDPENFNLQGSHDGVSWITVAEFIGETFDNRHERKEFRFSNGLEFTYYRLNITKNKGDDTLMQIAEVQFVGPIYTSADHSDPAGTVAVEARSSTGPDEAGAMAFDKDINTVWADDQAVPSVDAPSWLKLSLPEAKAIETLVLTSASDAAGSDPEDFSLEASPDGGVSWIALASWSGESFDNRLQRRQFNVANTLAFDTYRLNISKNKGGEARTQIAEIGLVGPKLPDLNHGRTAGVDISVRNAISAEEAGVKAFDGKADTKWLDHNDWKGAPSEVAPSWVQVKLPTAATVNKLAITSAGDADARDPQNFNIEASNDGVRWIKLASWVGEGFDQRLQRRAFSFSNQLAFSYYKVNITKNKGDDTLMQVAEIELIGPQYQSVDHSSAAGKIISARNRIGNDESEDKAFDDDVATKWLDHNEWKGAPTEANPSWIQLDLPAAKIVSSVAITSAGDADSRDPENFNIEGSNDGGKTWTRIGSWIGESWNSRAERKIFEMGNGFAYTTYRLNITKNKGDDTLMQIAEIELIGPEL